jgi:putative transposase
MSVKKCRFDSTPRDMGEIPVFYHRFLCHAISADLVQTVPLREIVNARKRRREQLGTIVKDRLKTVDTLLEFKRGMQERTFMQARSFQ